MAASAHSCCMWRILPRRFFVDINAVDKDGLTALHKAIIGKKQAITNYLLRNSANPFILDKDGWTPLHVAVQARRTDVARLLLIKGADKTIKDKVTLHTYIHGVGVSENRESEFHTSNSRRHSFLLQS